MSTTEFPAPPPDNSGKTAAAVIVSLVILAIIGVVSCYWAKKMRKAIVTELQAAVAPPAPAYNVVHQVWAVDAPTMEKFLQELAKEKPVRFTAHNYVVSQVLTRPLWVLELHEIAIGTAKGIAYLHEECQQRIIHYDIKPGNVLVDANFFPKVADFGLAKLCNRDNTHVSVTGYRGTPGYSAPEFMLNNFPITHKCDVYSFGMMLVEIVGMRKNTIVGSNESLDWFPKHVWGEYEKGELEAMRLSCGIEAKDRVKAERMCMVALWCVQDALDAWPPMSAVVKMLEGGVEIMAPPKPFHYLFSVGLNVLKPPSNSGNSSDYSISELGTNSHWYKDTTPIMAKYEIQIASSS
ncbi:hypothetical protein F0562_018403 [Nyssa sinensis]|uniref:Protein kinase domain-containing protein n=1 Tax=Nyssa sinensis TaxID=561372 RepID=A0A5J4ZDJ7_9ASTE|nr:hypothetical protein F0562_018403 [Nyssa sinensis]